MLPDRVSNPGPLTYESGALPVALRGPAHQILSSFYRSFLEIFDRKNGKITEWETKGKYTGSYTVQLVILYILQI